VSETIKRQATAATWRKNNLTLPYFMMLLAMIIGLYTMIAQIIPVIPQAKIGMPLLIIIMLVSFAIVKGLSETVSLVRATKGTSAEGDYKMNASVGLYLVILTATLILFAVYSPDWLKGVYAIDNLRTGIQSILGGI